MNNAVPHPFPTRLITQVNMDLTEARVIDSNARFIVRRLIATAYAEGFYDGDSFASLNEFSDRIDRENAAEESS